MRIWEFSKDDSGANMVEYALLVALIGVAAIGSIFPAISNGINSIFNKAGETLVNTAGS
jgi:Flp pilus assembly pilin Flp